MRPNPHPRVVTLPAIAFALLAAHLQPQIPIVENTRTALAAAKDVKAEIEALRAVPPIGGTITLEQRVEALRLGMKPGRSPDAFVVSVQLLTEHADHEPVVAEFLALGEKADKAMRSLDKKAFRRRSSIPTLQRLVGQKKIIDSLEGITQFAAFLGRHMKGDSRLAEISNEEITANFEAMRAVLARAEVEQRMLRAVAEALAQCPTAAAVACSGRLLEHCAWDEESFAIIDALLARRDRAGLKAVAARIKQVEGAIAEIRKRKPKKPGKRPKRYTNSAWKEKLAQDKVAFKAHRVAEVKKVRAWFGKLAERLHQLSKDTDVDTPPEATKPFSSWKIWAATAARKLPKTP